MKGQRTCSWLAGSVLLMLNTGCATSATVWHLRDADTGNISVSTARRQTGDFTLDWTPGPSRKQPLTAFPASWWWVWDSLVVANIVSAFSTFSSGETAALTIFGTSGLTILLDAVLADQLNVDAGQPPRALVVSTAEGQTELREVTWERWAPGFTGTLSDPGQRITKISFAHNGRVVYQVAEQDIKAPTKPPVLVCEARFQDDSGNNVLDGDEKAVIHLRVSNQGKGKATGLRANVTGGVPGVEVVEKVTIGDILPGGVRDVELPVHSTRELRNGRASLTVALVDRFGFDAPLVRQSFETRAFVPPRFAIKLGVEDANENGLVERGEELKLKVVVKNDGGHAKAVRLKLESSDAIRWLEREDAVTLGDIAPGDWKEATFSCLIRNQYEGPESLALKAVLTENRLDLGTTMPLTLTLNQAGPRIIETMAQAKLESVTTSLDPELGDPVDTAPKRKLAQPDAFAVIIGVESYGHRQVPAVTFAKRDATIMKEYLTKTMGVPTENVVMLLDQQATLANLRTWFSGKLANSVDGKNARVYVYFAGHGVPNIKTQKPFLVPHDGDPAYPDTSCLALEEVYRELGKLDAPVTVMLDACFSGVTSRSDEARSLVANIRPAVVTLKAGDLPSNVSVLAATNGLQVSNGFPRKRHGLFTYFLLKGLGGEADVNDDGRLTLQELHDYLGTKVKAEARKLNMEQTPTLQGRSGVAIY